VLARVLRMAARYPARLALATASSLGATCFAIAIPRLLGVAIDRAHSLLAAGPQRQDDALTALTATGLLLVGVSLIRGLLQGLAGFQSEHIGQSVGRDLRLAFFEKLQRLGFGFHDRIHSGDLITRGMLDLEGVRGFIENGLQRLLTLVLLVVVGAVLMALQDPLLAALALSFVPVAGWSAGRMGYRLRLAWTALQERLGVLSRIMEENLQGSRLVRAFAAGPHELAKFDVAGDAALEIANRRIVTRSRGMAAINASYFLAMALVLWVGGQRVQAGVLTIGQLTEFLTFMTLLQLPVRQVGMIVNSSARAVSSGRRLFEILDLRPVIADTPGAEALSVTDAALRFDQVRFAYRPDGPDVLDEISFEVRRGRVLAITGASGSGKSSLAQLIPRFYDVTGGAVTIDGQDIRDVTLDSVRGAVGLVQQDVFLFDDSVRSNLAYAAPQTEEPGLLEAAAVAQIDDHVAALPGGYETRVGERGVRLSGGQRQRLAIARGLVPAPAILIFDDAASAVDAATDERIRAGLRRRAASHAVIIISHRIAALIEADEILVLDDGRIVERGTHRQLFEQGGRYAALYRAQARGGERPARRHVA
jgi:ATP-binding cassette, subfamily B, multidrug efflux pump